MDEIEEDERKYCSVRPPSECIGLCCYYCESKDKCGFHCDRRYPEICKNLISKEEFNWRRILSEFEKSVC